ncbi:DUF342 domain-containing protein [Aminithiophilus ramosus]|uniref:DUF342 domain-containing protein n=2 Tax=Synergistales TaxID=649776 RepID=A0A9Q7EVK5_9BACT|nr:FapA family protein [Aminithiophilus ramosus]QTX32049.1 DUF342 domain-containing protein [Aminithiophilus ramosus]QVL35889.1 DUF342 domain-containing protein [Synergistota bacterium]
MRDEPFNLLLENLLRDVESLSASGRPTDAPSSADGTFHLHITEDRMSVFVDLFPSFGEGLPLDPLAVKEALVKEGVYSFLEGELTEAVERCESTKEPLRHLLAAQGIPPREPVEGRLEILFSLEREITKTGEKSEDTLDRIDHKERSPILSVAPGQLLAILHPSLPGEAGRDIFGQTVLAADPTPVTLDAGPGVLCENGTHFISETWGQPLLDGKTLSVRPVLDVDGDVDYRTGNIRFEGSISIAGGVREGFFVQAGFDIDVQGVVEGASIRAGRDIHIRGGLVGGKALVEAGGSLRVRFIEGGTIRADGSVLVDSHVLHGTVLSRDTVRVKGRKGILAGSILALKRIEAEAAGSPLSSQTRLAVGEDFRLRRRIEELDREITLRETTLLHISRTIEELKERFTSGRVVLPPEKLEQFRAILQQFSLLQKDLSALRDERGATLARLVREAQGGVVAIRRVVHAGTTISIQNRQLTLIEGERFVSFSLDGDSWLIVRGPYA